MSYNPWVKVKGVWVTNVTELPSTPELPDGTPAVQENMEASMGTDPEGKGVISSWCTQMSNGELVVIFNDKDDEI